MVSVWEIEVAGAFTSVAPLTLLLSATVQVKVVFDGNIFPPPFDNGTLNAVPLHV